MRTFFCFFCNFVSSRTATAKTIPTAQAILPTTIDDANLRFLSGVVIFGRFGVIFRNCKFSTIILYDANETRAERAAGVAIKKRNIRRRRHDISCEAIILRRSDITF